MRHRIEESILETLINKVKSFSEEEFEKHIQKNSDGKLTAFLAENNLELHFFKEIKELKESMDEFFNTVSSETIVKNFEDMGCELEDIFLYDSTKIT